MNVLVILKVLPVLCESFQIPKCLRPHSGTQKYTFYTQCKHEWNRKLRSVVFCFWFWFGSQNICQTLCRITYAWINVYYINVYANGLTHSTSKQLSRNRKGEKSEHYDSRLDCLRHWFGLTVLIRWMIHFRIRFNSSDFGTHGIDFNSNANM